jgi:HK97 family phage major capsid protein
LDSLSAPADIHKEDSRDLVEERRQLLTTLRATVEKNISEKREPTAADEAAWDRGIKRIEAINAELEDRKAKREEDRARRMAEDPDAPGIERYAGNGTGLIERGPRGGQAPLIFRTRDGREIRAVRPGESFASAVRGSQSGAGSDISIGAFVRAAIAGPRSPAESRALAETTQSGGAYLVPTPLATQLIDILRNATQCVKAGAAMIPMESSTLSFARATSDPTVAWKTELDAITPHDPGLEPLVLAAHTLVGMTIISVEIAEDAVNGEDVIGRMLGNALALELDRAALRGSGTPPEPTGVLNQDNVQTVDHNAVLSTYAPFSDAVGKLLTANVQPNGIIYSPAVAIALDKLTATDSGQPLMPPPSFAALPKYVTNQIPANLGTPGVETEAYVADWREMLIGMRTSATLEVSRVAAGAFENLAVAVRVYLRADIQLRHPAAFCVIGGIGRAGGG